MFHDSVVAQILIPDNSWQLEFFIHPDNNFAMSFIPFVAKYEIQSYR